MNEQRDQSLPPSVIAKKQDAWLPSKSSIFPISATLLKAVLACVTIFFTL